MRRFWSLLVCTLLLAACGGPEPVHLHFDRGSVVLPAAEDIRVSQKKAGSAGIEVLNQAGHRIYAIPISDSEDDRETIEAEWAAAQERYEDTIRREVAENVVITGIDLDLDTGDDYKIQVHLFFGGHAVSGMRPISPEQGPEIVERLAEYCFQIQFQ